MTRTPYEIGLEDALVEARVENGRLTLALAEAERMRDFYQSEKHYLERSITEIADKQRRARSMQ